jgi:hypothetical protein
MDVDDLKAELTVATDAALNVGDLLAAAVESGEEALTLVSTYRALLRRVKMLRRELVSEVAG